MKNTLLLTRSKEVDSITTLATKKGKQMALTDDPRERLVVLGNELLDVIYEEEVMRDAVSAVDEIRDLPVEQQLPALEAYMTKKGLTKGDMLATGIQLIITAQHRNDKIDEYAKLRATIEKLDEPRPEVPVDEIKEHKHD